MSTENGTYKVTITTGNAKVYMWILEQLNAMRQLFGDDAFSLTIHKPKGKGDEEEKDRTRVQYRAVGGTAALKEIGAHTVMGVVYNTLLTTGPQTEKALVDAKICTTSKAAQSSLNKLKTRGYIVPEELSK